VLEPGKLLPPSSANHRLFGLIGYVTPAKPNTMPQRRNSIWWHDPNQTAFRKHGTLHTDPTGDGWTPEDIKEMWAQKLPFLCHAFEAACVDLDIEHRLTKAPPSRGGKPRRPWTNSQVERMNRTIKEVTVKRYHYETHDQLGPCALFGHRFTVAA